MDRIIIYPNQLPYETDLLHTNQDTMKAFGGLLASVFGSGTYVNGLACTQTTVASLSVVVAAGQIITLTTVEPNAYSSLGSDSTDPLMKMGMNIAATTLGPMTAPVTAGQSVIYLVEATFSEADSGSTVLPYYNASNPAIPYSGPANAGTSQNTRRLQTVTLALKQGTAATTGSQTAPSTDTGYVPLYYVTIANGQSTITASNIAVAVGAPFVPFTLPGAPTPHGQCRLSVSSSSSLKLSPFGGNWIRIAGVGYQIPQAGITISNAGLSAATLYYVYVYNNSGTLALSLSTTGHATDTATNNCGVEIMSGNNAYTLVGMLYTGAGSPGTFVSSQQVQTLANWFNRRNLPLNGILTSAAISTTSFGVIGSAGNLACVTWADEALQLQVGGQVNSTSNASANLTFFINGSSGQGNGGAVSVPTSGLAYPIVNQFSAPLSEGYVLAQPGGAASTGTINFAVAACGVVRG